MTRRTTVTASSDALELLEGEARRRGVSLSAVIREAIEEKAEDVRKLRPRPRVGLFASKDGNLSALSWMDEDAPYRDQV